MTLVPINANTLARQSAAIQEMAVSSYLEQARDWLATAVEQTGPEQIAGAKAQIATAAEATKQLGLSKEIQLDAQEMVRRAEYALGKAIRKGQEEGTVAKKGDTGHKGSENVLSTLPGPTDFASDVELYDRPSQGKAGILSIADAAPSQEEFDAALAAAKEEGNLSRANVARKIKKQECDRGPSRADKAEIIRTLAAKGWTSEQMRKEVGYAKSAQVRELAREHDITIPGDAVRAHRRFNHSRVLDNVTEAIEVAAMSLRDVDPAQLDEETALERLDSLTTSINALSKAVKKIKESFHG